jgi:hypothetical protein
VIPVYPEIERFSSSVFISSFCCQDLQFFSAPFYAHTDLPASMMGGWGRMCRCV